MIFLSNHMRALRNSPLNYITIIIYQNFGHIGIRGQNKYDNFCIGWLNQNIVWGSWKCQNVVWKFWKCLQIYMGVLKMLYEEWLSKMTETWMGVSKIRISSLLYPLKLKGLLCMSYFISWPSWIQREHIFFSKRTHITLPCTRLCRVSS